MIKKINFTGIVLIGLIITMISCNSKKSTDSKDQIIKDYYSGCNSGNFNMISECISDSIMTTEMEYILTRNRNELYKQFQWDSVFQPKYNLIDLENDSNSYVATISKICKRIDFLQDTVITFTVKIDFKDDKIIKMQLTDYVLLDFIKWQQRTETLISWINQNYPELSGFNNDLTKSGAQKFLKAVDLYRDKN